MQVDNRSTHAHATRDTRHACVSYTAFPQVKDVLGLGAPGRLPEGSSVPAAFLDKLAFLGAGRDALLVCYNVT
jgi:hypothetical protein